MCLDKKILLSKKLQTEIKYDQNLTDQWLSANTLDRKKHLNTK